MAVGCLSEEQLPRQLPQDSGAARGETKLPQNLLCEAGGDCERDVFRGTSKAVAY